MKRIILMLLCVIGFAVSTAQAEQITLAELKQQTPERLQMEVTTDAGETVAVDAPIILPEEEMLPILEAALCPVNSKALQETYGKHGKLLWGTGREPNAEDYAGIWINPFGDDGKSALTGKRSQMQVPRKLGGDGGVIFQHTLTETPENNPLSPGAPQAKMREVLEIAGLGDLDIRFAAQVTTRRPYRSIEKRQTDPEWGILFTWEPDFRHPIPGYEMGYYLTGFSQYFYGAQLFGSIYSPVAFQQRPKTEKRQYWGQGLSMRMIADDDFYVASETLLRERSVLEVDAPLAPFSAIQQAVEERMRAGKLRSVFSVELGYMIRFPEGTDQSGNTRPESYILAPVWRVRGEDEKDHYNLIANDRRISGEDGSYSYDLPLAVSNSLDFEIRIDAETGAMIDDYTWTTYPRGNQ